VPHGAVAIVLGAMAGGCTLITDSFLTNEFSGDPYPINVDTSTGAVIVGMRPEGSEAPEDRDAVLDLLSPITVIDPGPMTTPSISSTDLMLLGETTPGSMPRVPRARFLESQVVSLHPCAGSDDTCMIGRAGAPHGYQGIIGADVLAGDAVRLRLGNDQISVLADVGGSDRGRSLDCDAVFDSPYRGGGTLVFPTTELAFGNRRITLQACLGEDPDPGPGPFSPDQLLAFRQHGADALFVVSTSIGISILSRAAYERYGLANPGFNVPAFDALPVDSVYLPSGLVTGRRAMLDRLALVATSTSNALSPCRQVYAHRLLSGHGPIPADQCALDGKPASGMFDCPCKDHSEFCAVPAILELTPPAGVAMPPAGIDVLVVDDSDPTLQSLRAELRPDQAEVDGILGTDVLRLAEIDVDYPHDRLLARCPGGNCRARPQLAQDQDRCQINHCIQGLLDFKYLPPTNPPDPILLLPGCK
jgi:hypothetical protein